MCLHRLQPRELRLQGGQQGRLPVCAGLWLREALPVRRLRLL
jgi:hypothetical protein